MLNEFSKKKWQWVIKSFIIKGFFCTYYYIGSMQIKSLIPTGLFR